MYFTGENKVIKELKQLDLKKCTPADVRKILELNDCIKPVRNFVISKGVFIVRVRKGYNWKTREEMTYPPADKCSSMQRASLPGEPIFYGVLSDDQHNLENACGIGCSECSKIFKDRNSIGCEQFTASIWVVVEPLCVISFITDKTYPKIMNNQLLVALRNSFHELRLKEDEESFLNYISNEFAKLVVDNRDYLISATIAADAMLEDTDGLLYPSVPFGGQAGLNIVLSPQAVDNKLNFIRTLGMTLYKNKTSSILRLEKATKIDGTTTLINQMSDSYLKHELGVSDLCELPLVD